MKILLFLSRNIGIIVLLIASLLFVSLVMAPAWAGDDHHGDTDIIEGDTTVTTDVTTGSVSTGATNTNVQTGGNKALALSNALGDVDIAGCLGSTQWATPLYSKQKLSTNWACLAEFYLRAEKYSLAAMAMCNTEVRHEFETEEDCRKAHDFTPVAAPAPVLGLIPDDDEEEIHNQYEAQFEQQRAMIDELRSQIQRPAIRPNTIVQKTEFLDEKKLAALRALREEK